MEKIFVDKVRCYCFDKGNEGLTVNYGWEPAIEVEDTEEAILKMLQERNVKLVAGRVYIAEHFDNENGRMYYEESLLGTLRNILEYERDRNEVMFPDINEFPIALTTRKINKYNLMRKSVTES